MDAKIMDWITKQHEKLQGDTRKKFLRALKFCPERTLQFIREHLPTWITYAMAKVGGSDDLSGDAAAELLAHFQKHFKPELDQIQP